MCAMAYVKAPLTGKVTSVCCYCRGGGGYELCPTGQITDCSSLCGPGSGKCHHRQVISGFSWPGPLDIAAPQGTAVYFLATDATVRSVRFEYYDGVCSDTSLRDSRGLVVRMYTQLNAQGAHIGSVMYGHLADREVFVAHNQVANATDWGPNWLYMRIGSVASSCLCSCSSGPHLHIDVQGGSPPDFVCDQDVSMGYHTIYRFYF